MYWSFGGIKHEKTVDPCQRKKVRHLENGECRSELTGTRVQPRSDAKCISVGGPSGSAKPTLRDTVPWVRAKSHRNSVDDIRSPCRAGKKHRRRLANEGVTRMVNRSTSVSASWTSLLRTHVMPVKFHWPSSPPNPFSSLRASDDCTGTERVYVAITGVILLEGFNYFCAICSGSLFT